MPPPGVTSSNDCFEINLTRPLSHATDDARIFSESFAPAFTYPIVNEEESLVGYKAPRIELDFRANDMRPSLKVSFEAKLDLKGVLPDDKLVDLETVFAEHIPQHHAQEARAAALSSDPRSKHWRPPGEQVRSFTLQGKQYEIWLASLANPAAKALWENMQILTLLFIEGASKPELDEQWSLERWSLYLLYDVTSIDEDCSPYTLAGFSTSYRYWIFPSLDIMRATKSLPSPPPSNNGDAAKYTPPRLTQDPNTFLFNERINPLEQPSRERISQYIILPPYQGQSLGAKLYDTIFANLSTKPFIYEIPVEDPNEAFDAMRDYSDIVFLRTLPAFQTLSIPPTLPPEKIAKSAPIPRDEILGHGVDLTQLRHEAKIVPRQFNRMLELHLLSTIPAAHRKKARITRKERSSNENDRRYYFWRLALKDRIYRQNFDALDQLEDAAQKVEMLEAAVDNQQDEYEERLEGIQRRAKFNEEGHNGATGRSRPKRKRRVVEDDDDNDDDDDDDDKEEEEEEEEEGVDVMSVASSKRMKT